MTQRTTHSRRRLIVVGMASAAALILAGCAPSGAEPAANDSSPAAASQSFKVGLLASTTGFAASMGKDLQQGWDLYWSQHDNKSGSFTLSAVFEDDASDPQTALTKAKKLVTEDKVDVVVGPVLANNSLAVADYLNQQKVADLSQTSADDVTQRKFSPVVLRTGAMGGSQTTFAAGQWAWDEGHKTASTLCPDYAFGWDSCAGFVSSFTAAGGTISKQLWYPNGTTDMSTYVAQLKSAGADVLFAGTTGGTDATGFLKSASDFGLLKSSPVITGCCTLGTATLANLGDMTLGVFSSSYYVEGAKQSAEFLKAFEAKYSVIPSVYSAGAYATAQMLDAALKNAKTKVTGEDLIKAIKDADLKGNVFGDVSFDDHNNIVGPVFIREVEKRNDGKLWNVNKKTYDAVSQFWTFDAKEFLSHPTFSQANNGQQK
jgi:branched-chain amino acid transport system substrate-binding protein